MVQVQVDESEKYVCCTCWHGCGGIAERNLRRSDRRLSQELEAPAAQSLLAVPLCTFLSCWRDCGPRSRASLLLPLSCCSVHTTEVVSLESYNNWS